MSILSDRQIRKLCASMSPMIEPFEPSNIRRYQGKKVISFGSSSFGYDVKLTEEFKIFTNVNNVEINPKELDEDCLVDGKIHEDEWGRYVIIPPNSYLLGRTKEYFNIPRDVLVLAVGKSTYARAGAIVNVTPIEPGFSGVVVVEVSNSTPLPMRIYANEGIAQFLFLKGDEECETSYADKDGKYQGQRTIVLPKV